MGGKGGGKMQVVDYCMSIHYRVCHGPVDAFEAVYVGEKAAWEGHVNTLQTISINRPDLFGGSKREGGVAGSATFLPGYADQVMPADLAARLGRTPETCPGYRGMASVFFTGTSVPVASGEGGFWGALTGFSYGSQGFMWSSNNPYLKPIWFRVRSIPRALQPEFASLGADSNPAHIIYECLTNTEWGQGGAPTGINIDSFRQAAWTLFNEGFGLSLMWTKQARIEDFVAEILDHIQATIFVNPRDGLTTIKLIRNDYNPDALPVLTPDNCTLTGFSRKAWGETVNEIIVTWTNPENEQEETVVAQNNANIAVQGGIISDSRNYYGVRNVHLAQTLAFRELATSSAPIATFDLEVDRSAWNFVPGGCVRLHYPEKHIDDVVIRIIEIDYGRPGDPSIKVTAMEDIFSLGRADFDPADDTQWEDPGQNPEAPEYARVITPPAFLISQAISQSEYREYPLVYAAALVSPDNDDTNAYNLYGESTLPNGTPVAELIGVRPTIGHALLPVALAAEPLTTLATFGPTVGGPGPRPSGFIIIGNVPEKGHEIAMVQSVTEEGGWVISRGCLDTIPRAWPDGTLVWFVSPDSNFIISNTVYGDGETARFKVSPFTSRGVLPFAESPVIASVMTGRPHLPLRPANVRVEGVAFGTADLSAAPPSIVNVTWSNRNRMLEDNQVLRWTDGTVAPEPGQTTTIRVLSVTGAVLATHAGLTGNSFAVPVASWGGAIVGDIEVLSERDGLESLQHHRIRVKVREGGWGDDWGADWGSTVTVDPGEPTPEPPPPDPDPDPTFPDLPPWGDYQPLN